MKDNRRMAIPEGSIVDVARAAAEEVAGADAVGAFLESQEESEVLGPLASFHFENLQPGYGGWFWSVSVSGDGPEATVNDVVALPGGTSIAAPPWTPYKERIRPGDLSPGDLLPPEEDDVRLVPAWSAGDDEDTVDRYFAREVGLGRPWVLSLAGRDLAADRWDQGATGPDNPMAEQAPGECRTCGFLVSLAGPLSQTFGVCANGAANADGRAVALTHGCGAHSDAKLSRSAAPQKLPPPVWDTVSIDEIDLTPPPVAAEPAGVLADQEPADVPADQEPVDVLPDQEPADD
jgi:hypothetical protein